MGHGALKQELLWYQHWTQGLEPGALRSLFSSRLTVLAGCMVLAIVGAALAAPLIAPYRPFDLGTLDLMDASQPPVWMAEGKFEHWLGTDEQGRDVWSAILFGMRASLFIGVVSVFLSLVLGTAVGLLAGYRGGWLDRIAMRIADVQLSLPPTLSALTLDGIGRVVLPRFFEGVGAYAVLIGALVLSGWPQYARVVRGLTLSEKHRDYIAAARLAGGSTRHLVWAHLFPNVTRPVWVLGTVHLATAILTESTLSFLGVGVPPTSPSLGTLISNGNNFVFSGQWWIVACPGLALVLLMGSLNVLGDGLQEALHPKLR